MNVYDTANKLAEEIKQSEEFIIYQMAKQAINLNFELKSKIEEFEKARYDAQIIAIQTGKDDENKKYYYSAKIDLISGGNYGYSFRVMPQNEMLLDSENMDLVKWIEK